MHMQVVLDKRTALSVRTDGMCGMEAGMVSLEDTVVYSLLFVKDCTVLFVYVLAKRPARSASSLNCGGSLVCRGCCGVQTFSALAASCAALCWHADYLTRKGYMPA
jgi:hypothetical protein